MLHTVTLDRLARHLCRPVPGVALEPAAGVLPSWLCTACVTDDWVLWRNAEGQLRAGLRGADPAHEPGRAVVGTHPERGEECAACALDGVGVWAGHRWLRLRNGRLVTGVLGAEPGTDVSGVVVDEDLIRRAAAAAGGRLAVDRDGRVVGPWAASDRDDPGVRLIWVR